MNSYQKIGEPEIELLVSEPVVVDDPFNNYDAIPDKRKPQIRTVLIDNVPVKFVSLHQSDYYYSQDQKWAVFYNIEGVEQILYDKIKDRTYYDSFEECRNRYLLAEQNLNRIQIERRREFLKLL